MASLHVAQPLLAVRLFSPQELAWPTHSCVARPLLAVRCSLPQEAACATPTPAWHRHSCLCAFLLSFSAQPLVALLLIACVAQALRGTGTLACAFLLSFSAGSPRRWTREFASAQPQGWSDSLRRRLRRFPRRRRKGRSREAAGRGNSPQAPSSKITAKKERCRS